MEKYEILELIGQGSFGRVFRGRCKATGNIVALKLIPKVGKTPRDIASLRHECKLQRELDHPNIVRMLDAIETDNEIIAVTEYVATGDLHKLFEIYKVRDFRCYLPETRVQQIAVDLICALHYLHSHRILHRDVKPQNVLIDSNGAAKLCDFGFARNLTINTYVLTSIKGTPLYMAPEMIDEKPYDHTADLWSVGCILYELAVGTPPFATHSLIQLIKKIRYEQISWPQHLSPECSGFLKGLLEKDSKQRLSWPGLLRHPFICTDIAKRIDLKSKLANDLTNILSESQELAKEIQRQDKAKLLPGGSQTLIKVAEKYEKQKKILMEAIAKKKESELTIFGSGYSRDRRYSDSGFTAGLAVPKADRRHSDLTAYYYHNQIGTNLAPTFFEGPNFGASSSAKSQRPALSTAISNNIPSSKKTSGHSETEILCSVENREKAIIFNFNSSEKVEDWSGDLEATLENDEWCSFLDSQLEEFFRHDSETLSNLNDVVLLLGPLHRYSNTSSLVMVKIVTLLMMPFEKEPDHGRLDQVLTVYSGVKVVPNLLFACKKLVKRNDFDDSQEALDLMLLLISRLVYTRQEFVSQLCETLSALRCSKIIVTLLEEPKLPVSIKLHCLAIINRVLSMPDSNPSDILCIVRDVFSDTDESFSRIMLDLLKLENVDITVKCLFMVGLLARIDRNVSNSWSQRDHFKNIIFALQKSPENDAIQNAANFCKKWICI